MDPKKGRALIALMDDAAFLKQITQLAEAWYTVRATNDPNRAMSWMTEDESVKVLVVDQTRHDGAMKVLRHAQAHRPACKRLIMTTHADLHSIVEGLHSGCINQAIFKPFSHAEVTAAIMPAVPRSAVSAAPIAPA